MMKVSVNTKVKSQVMCIIWCWMFMSILTPTEAGSCREAALCCNGRDSSCVVQKTAINVINEDPNEKPCYCDHACLKLGDCCEDFKSNCGGKWSWCVLRNASVAVEFLMIFSCRASKIYSSSHWINRGTNFSPDKKKSRRRRHRRRINHSWFGPVSSAVWFIFCVIAPAGGWRGRSNKQEIEK